MLELPFNLRHRFYIFIFGSTITFILRRIELALLKRLRKTIVVFFCGCDIRHWRSHEAAVKKLGCIPICQGCDMRSECNENDKLKTVRIFEKYADYIYTRPDAAGLLSRAYHLYWLPIELHKYEYCVPENPIPKILHAPSNISLKGTPFIEEAIERLRSEGYRFEFIRLENMNNRDIKEHLTSADIVVDQLKSYGPANLALESMASGCAVLAGCKPEFDDFPLDVPVVDVGPDTIYEKLKHLIKNPNLISQMATRGRKYVEESHDSRKVVSDIAKTIGLLR